MTNEDWVAVLRDFFEMPEEHIRENNRLWGEENWVLCLQESCYNRGSDGAMKPQFHHKDFHR